MTLRKALRERDLPEIAAETIREVLHEAGYRYLRTRTWVRTGYALRVRKSGTVTTYDPQTPGKKDGSALPTRRRKGPGSCGPMQAKRGPIRPARSLAAAGHRT